MPPGSPPPLLVAHLLPKVDALLIDLLRSLTPEAWEIQTVAPAWRVKDVAAHLLDTQLRKLSICRDGVRPDAGPVSPRELAALVNRLNQDGVTVYRRLSSTVLISLLEWAAQESASYHLSIDPFAEAVFPVSWAGEARSLNWFDTARELTERWHHQQQIRLAVDRPGIMTRELYFPVIDCFMRALPHAYRDRVSEPGTMATFEVTGECGGTWYLFRDGAEWRLIAEPAGREVSRTSIPQEIAWRVFTRGIDRSAARARVVVSGEHELGLHVLEMIAIVA